MEKENAEFVTAEDFYAAIARIEKEYRREEEERAEEEFQRRLREEKEKWEKDYRSLLEGMVQDLSREDKRQAKIEEERNHWEQEASQLRGEMEILK